MAPDPHPQNPSAPSRTRTSKGLTASREVAELLTWARYGYHMPRTHARDNYYKKLEDERAARTQG